MKNINLFFTLAFLSSYGLQAQGQANPVHPQLTNTHTILLGAFQQDVDAEFYADADDQNLPSAKISLGDLGMDETDLSWLAEYRYRMSDKWLFSVGGYKFDTSGSIEAQKTIVYDGVEFDAEEQEGEEQEEDEEEVDEALIAALQASKKEVGRSSRVLWCDVRLPLSLFSCACTL